MFYILFFGPSKQPANGIGMHLPLQRRQAQEGGPCQDQARARDVQSVDEACLDDELTIHPGFIGKS